MIACRTQCRSLCDTNEVSSGGNKMDVKLSDIVKSNYCYYDLYAGCVKGLEMPHSETCSKCVADAHSEIIRRSGNGTR